MSKIDLRELADSVVDELTFIHFLEALAADWEDEAEWEKKSPSPPYGAGINGWEHGTIGAYLEAAAAWAKATSRTYQHERTINPWTRCAHILLMGKYYE